MKVVTGVGELRYVSVTGDGVNTALPGAPEHYQYTASLVAKEGSKLHKDIEKQIMEEWKVYKEKYAVKGMPNTNGIKKLLINDPEGTIDPNTEEVAKVPSGDVIITFKTNVTYPDGKKRVVRIKDYKGRDVTDIIANADWAIGSGSTGRIFGTAVGNNIGGTHKVTLYLDGIQLGKLQKYTGDDFEVTPLDSGDEVADDGVNSVDSGEVTQEDQKPDL